MRTRMRLQSIAPPPDHFSQIMRAMSLTIALWEIAVPRRLHFRVYDMLFKTRGWVVGLRGHVTHSFGCVPACSKYDEPLLPSTSGLLVFCFFAQGLNRVSIPQPQRSYLSNDLHKETIS